MSDATAWPISELDPASILNWMPGKDQIPAEFAYIRRGPWNVIAMGWLFCGLPKAAMFYPRGEVDQERAIRAIKKLLCSHHLGFEYRIEATAFLLSLWFKRVEKWKMP